MKTCFFIGHRDAPPILQERLEAAVEYLVRSCGVREFVVGYHGAFDRMATASVQRIKMNCPEICAYRLLPYFPGEHSVMVPEQFDGTYYPEGMEMVPRRFAIEKANQKMLAASDYLLAYVCRDGGNAAKLLRRAKSLEKRGGLRIINLAEKEDIL